MRGWTFVLSLLLSSLPALVLVPFAFTTHLANVRSERTDLVSESAKIAATGLDQYLQRLLELTSFCAADPGLVAGIQVEAFKNSCGRYAEMIGAWVVVIALGETHSQIINTRENLPPTLPTYPRSEERPELIAVEALSKRSGKPEIAPVFRGRFYTGGIISAGQWLRLHDGREAMLYVSFSAEDISTLLARFSNDGQITFALVDPSRRIVARSKGIEDYLFSEAPRWLWNDIDSGLGGAQLGVAGPIVIGGAWDAGYFPLSSAEKWMAVAVKPVAEHSAILRPVSQESAFVVLGLVLSFTLFWFNAYRFRAVNLLREAREKELASERASQEKSKLLASLAHDVRAPLISMIGALVGLERKASKDNIDLSVARTSAENLLQLIDDFLELSFIGSNEFSLNPTPVDLRKLIKDVLVLIEDSAHRKGLALEVLIAANVPIAVEVDRLRLQQVLGNLLSNAVKYTDEGKVILNVLVLSESLESVDLRFVVEDTGHGIPFQEQEKVLREFGRLERLVERREQGAGLGLAICNRILRAMGSEIKVKSTVGLGSTFSFTLSKIKALRAVLPVDGKPLRDLTIIYAEDEPVINSITSRQLEEAGATVIAVRDGAEALARLRTVTPDLLLLDVQMPGLNGLETIRRVNAVVPSRRFPVFLLTSHISGSMVNEARKEGADEVFTKPLQVLPMALSLLDRLGKAAELLPAVALKSEVNNDLISVENFMTIACSDIVGLQERHLPEFSRRMHEDIQKINVSVQNQNLDSVRVIAHRCLGVCQVLGAQSLALRMRFIEDAAESGNLAVVLEHANGLSDLLSQTLGEMKNRIDGLSTISS